MLKACPAFGLLDGRAVGVLASWACFWVALVPLADSKTAARSSIALCKIVAFELFLFRLSEPF